MKLPLLLRAYCQQLFLDNCHSIPVRRGSGQLLILMLASLMLNPGKASCQQARQLPTIEYDFKPRWTQYPNLQTFRTSANVRTTTEAQAYVILQSAVDFRRVDDHTTGQLHFASNSIYGAFPGLQTDIHMQIAYDDQLTTWAIIINTDNPDEITAKAAIGIADYYTTCIRAAITAPEVYTNLYRKLKAPKTISEFILRQGVIEKYPLLGMTADEIERFFGKPPDIIKYLGFQYWLYDRQNNFKGLVFSPTAIVLDIKR